MPAKKCFATYEEVYELYINQNMTRQEVADHFGMSKSGMTKVITALGITKPKDLITKKNKEILMEAYGVECPFSLPEVREKSYQTIKERLGVEHPAQNPEIVKKMKATMIERHGAPTPLQCDEIHKRVIERLKENYGVDNPMKSKEIKERAEETNLWKYGVRNLFYKEEYSHDSKEEQCLRDYVERLGIKTERTRDIIPPLEIDIYCPEYKIGIEFNGIYWHSDRFRDKDYHQIKSLMARKQGVFLFHVFEDEMNSLRKREKMFARIKDLFNPHFDYTEDEILIDMGKVNPFELEKHGYKFVERYEPKCKKFKHEKFVVFDCGSELWRKRAEVQND